MGKREVRAASRLFFLRYDKRARDILDLFWSRRGLFGMKSGRSIADRVAEHSGIYTYSIIKQAFQDSNSVAIHQCRPA